MIRSHYVVLVYNKTGTGLDKFVGNLIEAADLICRQGSRKTPALVVLKRRVG